MSLPDNVNTEKLTEVALAILWLSAYTDSGATRAWKALDWELTDLLFTKGWIGNPRSKAKSVPITEEGARLAESFLDRHFGK